MEINMLKNVKLFSTLFILFFYVAVNVFPQSKIELINYVNPFIGTSNGGNTFPGAVVPWGMVSVSPHNSPGTPSGYIYGEKYFYGFGHTHLSGTGCSELGNIVVTLSKTNSANPENYKTTYSNESATPGNYSLFLDEYKIKAEVSASERSGIIKFTSEEEMEIDLLVDVGQNLSLVGGGEIEILSSNEITGYNISGGFCGEENRKNVYFYSVINYEADKILIYEDDKIIDRKISSVIDNPLACSARLKLIPDKPLIIKTGMSYTSKENAKNNLLAELPHWDFDQVVNEARNKWNDVLSRITINDKNKTNLTKFYSALYHMFIHPNIINDVNGDYPTMNEHETMNKSDRNRYTIYSLWDTYRTLHPFLTLVYPDIQSDMIKTMLDMYDEQGYLPKWELIGNETYMMVGDPAVPVIVDSYVKGVRDFDINKAYEAILKPVTLDKNEKAPPVRAAYHYILEYGYIPFDQNMEDEWWAWGPVSTSLEYNYADWTISQLAELLNDENNKNIFYKRSLGYKKMFDPVTQLIRPKLKNGDWMEPFDPLETEGSGDWTGSGGPGYVEGNAWNYTWFVPHDVYGLIELFGGEKEFAEKLLESFNNGQFTINNEPDIFYPYLFKYTENYSHYTSELVDQIMNTEFGIDENGLPGNDDCGTISGWFVFSVLGFYPVCPGSDEYVLNEPLFDEIKIQLDQNYYQGNELVIKKREGNKREVILNGESVNLNFIKHSELIKGGELVFIIPDGENK
ncbi:MAG TPA: glycoside hydrolase family 92 protein [Ignavibacteria bacterium]|nr:glycoside hydrolase family 92 protein [Ignavibacteria bacterium]